MFGNMETSEFTGENLEAQEIMREGLEENTEISPENVELSKEVQEMDSTELRKLASDEYAHNGATPLRARYLELAAQKEAGEKHSQGQISFGSGYSSYSTSTLESKLKDAKRAYANNTKVAAEMTRQNAEGKLYNPKNLISDRLNGARVNQKEIADIEAELRRRK